MSRGGIRMLGYLSFCWFPLWNQTHRLASLHLCLLPCKMKVLNSIILDQLYFMNLYIGHLDVNKNAKRQVCEFNKVLSQPWNLENITNIFSNLRWSLNSRTLDWIISDRHCGADFPKEQFCSWREEDTHFKALTGGSSVPGHQLLGNPNKNTHGNYVVRTLIINIGSEFKRYTWWNLDSRHKGGWC